MFLGKGDVTASTHYGLKPSDDSDSALVLDCYQTIAAAAATATDGMRGLITIDITNPRVKGDNNTLQRAKRLVRLHPCFLSIVIRGDGVYMVHAGTPGSRIATAAAAVAAGTAAGTPTAAAAGTSRSAAAAASAGVQAAGATLEGASKQRKEATACLAASFKSSSSSGGSGSSGSGRCTTQLVAGFTAAAKKQLCEKRRVCAEPDAELEVLETLQVCCCSFCHCWVSCWVTSRVGLISSLTGRDTSALIDHCLSHQVATLRAPGGTSLH